MSTNYPQILVELGQVPSSSNIPNVPVDSVDLTAIRARVTALEASGGAAGGFDPSTILSRIAADEGNLAAAILRVTSQEEITNDLLGDTPAVWVANTHYIPGTVVKHDGALWRCLVNGSLAIPGDDEDWKEINLQRMQDDMLHETYALPNDPLTVGALRMMRVGDTYRLPTTPQAVSPGSTTMMDVAQTALVGIQDRGHRLINAVMVRTGEQTWTITAEEYTGTADSPTVTWVVDIDSAWPDHTGIGGVPGTSFTNVVFDLRREIGDASVFGSDSVVGKIQALEAALSAASARIGVLEASGGSTSAHQAVAPDWTMPVNDQGPNYCIITDDKTDPDHIGIDLLDGAGHKVALAWKAGFDPTAVDDGAGGTENWDTMPPSVWVQSGVVFKQVVDPVTKAVVTYGAVKHFIDGHSILTLLWNSASGHFEVRKVEHGGTP